MTVLEDVIRPGTRRGLDFVVLEELRKRTGIVPNEVLKFAMAEMLCNALDTDATKFTVNVENESDFVKLTIKDNGSKRLTKKDIKLILDFENKASSKRGFLRVSRGYLGNALKCIIGYCYALAKEKSLSPPAVIIESGSNRYEVALIVDRVKETITSEIKVARRTTSKKYTTFTVKLPANPQTSSLVVLKDIVFATSMVNPTRQISYDFYGDKGLLGSTVDNGGAIRQQTSVLWYTQKQFETLFSDFIRATPDTQLKEFIAMFRGFTAKGIIREILQKMNALNHDLENGEVMQFFPSTAIREVPRRKTALLFHAMRDMAKPVSTRSISSVLGCVGEKQFEALRERHEWKRLRYVKIPCFKVECRDGYHYKPQHLQTSACPNPSHVAFPYLIELAIFDREDGDGLKVYQCVNFMASMEDIFSRIFDIKFRLGQVGITKDTPVTVLAHLVCPVLKWLNYGKSGLDE